MGRTCVRPMNVSYGVGEGIRTLGPHVANVMLSQLSYIPRMSPSFAKPAIGRSAILPLTEKVVNDLKKDSVPEGCGKGGESV